MAVGRTDAPAVDDALHKKATLGDFMEKNYFQVKLPSLNHICIKG